MIGIEVPFVGTPAAELAPFNISKAAKALAALRNLTSVHADGAHDPVC
jgi:hypothetical protein